MGSTFVGSVVTTTATSVALNAYATCTEYNEWTTPVGQSDFTDTSDDEVIQNMLESVSRYIDGQTNRTFYPRIETRYYSIPSGRLLILDDDLLTLTTLTNGDNDEITSTYYNLLDKNHEPKWGIELKETSSVYWETDSDGNSEHVLDVLGWWGFHERFTQRGWASGGTLASAISSTTSTSLTATAGHDLIAGQIIKIDSEIMIVSSAAAQTVTVNARGDNGSTAATHANSSVIYIWKPMEDIRQATLLITQSLYQSRSGQVAGGRVTVTASGVVIRPEDVPPSAQQTIDRYRRLV